MRPYCFFHEPLYIFFSRPFIFSQVPSFFFTSPFIARGVSQCPARPESHAQNTNNEQTMKEIIENFSFPDVFLNRNSDEDVDVGDADGAIEDHFQQNWFVSPRRAQECIHCFKAHHSTDGDNQIKLFKKPTASMVPDQ